MLHLFHPAVRTGLSRHLPPLPLTVSPPPLPQPPPPLSHFLLVSVAQASPLSAEVCTDTAGVHHAWLLGGGRSVRESSCGRLRTHAQRNLNRKVFLTAFYSSSHHQTAFVSQLVICDNSFIILCLSLQYQHKLVIYECCK